MFSSPEACQEWLNSLFEGRTAGSGEIGCLRELVVSPKKSEETVDVTFKCQICAQRVSETMLMSEFMTPERRGERICSPCKAGAPREITVTKLPEFYASHNRCPNEHSADKATICQGYKQAHEKLCKACKVVAERELAAALIAEHNRPKVRTMIGSDRRCTIVTGCTGTMRAHLRWEPGPSWDHPTLHWTCTTCKGEMTSGEGKAARNVLPVVPNRKKFLSGSEALTAYKSEAAEQAEHIAGILKGDGGIYCQNTDNPALWTPKATCPCSKCRRYYGDAPKERPLGGGLP